MQEQPFLTTEDYLGYAEEYLIVETGDKEDSRLLNYSLSNSLDDIKVAIFSKTGKNINLDNAYWKVNPELSVSVKHLMNKHRVTYSMATWQEGKRNRHVVVNMRVNDKWFVTGFDEIRGSFFSWYNIEIFYKIRDFFGNGFSDETDDEC